VDESARNDDARGSSDIPAKRFAMKILLVDNSPTMRSIQKKILESLAGAEFFEASDGLEALTVLASVGGSVDVLLVEWNLPNLDGLTLVRKIREKDKKTPVIMFATEAVKPRIMDALKAGVNNFVVKPFTPEVLLEKLNATLKKCQGQAAA
jgi:two-component system chemotaxis response regulator CheY